MMALPSKGGKPKPCNKEACDIQTCLSKNDFDVERCIPVVMRLRDCCDRVQNKSRHCASLSGLLGTVEATVHRADGGAAAGSGQGQDGRGQGG